MQWNMRKTSKYSSGNDGWIVIIIHENCNSLLATGSLITSSWRIQMHLQIINLILRLNVNYQEICNNHLIIF